MYNFDFGANWQAFSDKHVDERRLAIARLSIQALLDQKSLDGMRVLDVGCGSGMFALAAHQLGAQAVVGIDINPRSIAASEQNAARFLPSARVSFHQVSVLDEAALAHLGTFDLVYAWGSLHHTGAMWQAIRHCASMVAPKGTFVVALYKQHSTSPIWLGIKWLYNRVPKLAQKAMIPPFAALIYVAKFLVTRRNPLEKQRGMDFWYDVIDWVGGYPYEYATLEAVENYVIPLGFKLRKVIPDPVPTGINEFVFERSQL
ncbi:MAG: methyltransferase domain-containing protein [Candidatus Viridilinea halotolerans]|uniref:Methyltransferase domain-containing protein n=1 Tax=Candidatus Viridilinea halotolerans TaxID=2491704 RepID=A0A426TSD2_9CHLR|nr:MAG: methyltransferase domain-containing protein [Candidatus Viridilinea halotolerans]